MIYLLEVRTEVHISGMSFDFGKYAFSYFLFSFSKALHRDLKRSNINVNFNPLLHSIIYIGHLTGILILKFEGIIKEFSYGSRVYESVDDGRLSWSKGLIIFVLNYSVILHNNWSTFLQCLIYVWDSLVPLYYIIVTVENNLFYDSQLACTEIRHILWFTFVHF